MTVVRVLIRRGSTPVQMDDARGGTLFVFEDQVIVILGDSQGMPRHGLAHQTVVGAFGKCRIIERIEAGLQRGPGVVERRGRVGRTAQSAEPQPGQVGTPIVQRERHRQARVRSLAVVGRLLQAPNDRTVRRIELDKPPTLNFGGFDEEHGGAGAAALAGEANELSGLQRIGGPAPAAHGRRCRARDHPLGFGTRLIRDAEHDVDVRVDEVVLGHHAFNLDLFVGEHGAGGMVCARRHRTGDGSKTKHREGFKVSHGIRPECAPPKCTTPLPRDRVPSKDMPFDTDVGIT